MLYYNVELNNTEAKYHQIGLVGKQYNDQNIIRIQLGGIITEGTDIGFIQVRAAPYSIVLEDDTYKGQIKIGFKFIAHVSMIRPQIYIFIHRKGCHFFAERSAKREARTPLGICGNSNGVFFFSFLFCLNKRIPKMSTWMIKRNTARNFHLHAI
ncbi:uncharacterized protein LOC111304735 [Durio zibethinus]|uniref:Uncharacterized protein LOC111304735 n=1 Tax=Durio zibethinus TaxID=66656 RepID=A0A6P5ZXW1_DURZI|nr:uncharacterized protein LOC111304735 [Durio zibethinus]